MSSQPYPSETDLDGWPLFHEGCSARYGSVGRVYPESDDPSCLVWTSRAAYKIGAGMPKDQAFAETWKELEDALWGPPDPPDPPDPIPGTLQPLVGYLRSFGTAFADDTGPRTLRLCSYFAAIRDYKDRPDTFRANLDAMVGSWHGARIFWCLMGAPWDGSMPDKNTVDLTVDVRWPDYDALFVAVLKEFASRGLRVSLTSGTLYPEQIPDAPLQYARIGKLCASVNEQTVILNAVINEPGMTSPYGDGPDAWPIYDALLGEFKTAYPWNHHGTGCQGGDPEAIENDGKPSGIVLGSRPPATFACLQGTRSPVRSCLERAFDAGYHVRPAVKVPVLEEEPTGEDYQVPCVYQPLTSHDDMLALFVLKLVTGQGFTYLNGPGLWDPAPLDSTWGFTNLSRLWAEMSLPETVSQWTVANLNHLPITGSGMYRCDGSYSDTQAVAVIHGGSGWVVQSKWDAQARVYRSDGLHLDMPVQAGGQIFAEGGSPVATVVILEKR